MPSLGEQAGQGDGPESGDRSPDVGGGGRKIGAGFWIPLVGIVIGGTIGVFAFWTDPKPEEMASPQWSWALPELSAEISPTYRELFETAQAAVTEVMNAYPGDPHAISALGVLCYLGHDRELEAETWEHCLELDPDNDLAFQRLCTLAQEEANHERIVELAETALKQAPDNANYASQLGAALLYLNRDEEAKSVLERLVRRGQADADSYFVLAEACYKLNDLQKAERYYSAASALLPFSSSMMFGLVKVCRKLGKKEKAAEYQQRFQELKDAEKAAAEQQDASSRQRFRDELHIPTRVSEILRYVGQAYLDAGELDLAEENWLQAAELSPQDSETRQLLANLYDGKGQLEEALRWVRELGDLFPDDSTHERNEALLLIRLKRFDEAERIFRDRCQAEPTRSAHYRDLAGLLLTRSGDLQEAKQLAVHAVELEPTAVNFSLLATVALQAGDRQTAQAAIAQALRLDPDNENYRSLYATVSQPE
jgi:tetratricopeptide (TPR) repeat protein